VTGSDPGSDHSALSHTEACKRWGLPDESEGSVNDPRTREENGVRYNEKWIYLLPEGDRRIVYWHRYDCRGVRVEDTNGQPKEVAG
jgi:hypothetical protein